MKVFAKWFFGFWSDSWPCLTLTPGGATNFEKVALPGDRVVFVGSGSSETAPEDRARLLGIAEVGDQRYATRDLVGREYRRATKKGELPAVDRWPVAFAMTRAWRFIDRPKIVDVFGQQLPSKARLYVAEMTPSQCARLAELRTSEELVRSSPQRDAEAERIEAVWGGPPTTGPVPHSWSKSVKANLDWPAMTYLMRFGNRDVWKVGWAKDLDKRLRDVNRHIPSELLKEKWVVSKTCSWPDPYKARDMEQKVLQALRHYRSTGERVRCEEADLLPAWTAAERLGKPRRELKRPG